MVDMISRHASIAPVRTSMDAGRFYCEHVYYTAQQLLTRPGGATPAAGFLHFPVPLPAIGTPERDLYEARAVSVMAAALRGYIEARPPRTEHRVLWTGFSGFANITHNPTGGLSGSASARAEVLRQAFPDASISLTQVGELERYTITTPGRPARTIILSAAVLPVSDEALNPGNPESIGSRIRSFRPDITLMTGLGLHEHFAAEGSATNGELRHSRHAKGRAPTHRLAVNRTLIEAIRRGNSILHP